MRPLNLLSGILILGALATGYFAYGQWEELEVAQAQNRAARAEVVDLQAELQTIEQVQEIRPAKFADAALSDFFTRTLEAGEVLGAGARIEGRGAAGGGTMGLQQFTELKYGLKVASVSVRLAASIEAAPTLFAMVEEEIDELPVAVVRIKANVQGPAATLLLDVDVFGR